MDDVIKVSGYRLGTAEIESAMISHPAVAESAAIGLPHEVKGQAIHVFCILRTGYTGTEALAEELRQADGKAFTPSAADRTRVSPHSPIECSASNASLHILQAVIPAKLVPECLNRGVGIQSRKTGFRASS